MGGGGFKPKYIFFAEKNIRVSVAEATAAPVEFAVPRLTNGGVDSHH